MTIKKIATRALTLTLKATVVSFAFAVRVFALLGVILKPFGRFFFRFCIVPGFGIYLFIRQKVLAKTFNFLDRLIFLVINRFVVHAIFVAIAAAVVTANILAYETREDYGRNALIHQIVGVENYDTAEEDTVTAAPEPQVYSYLGDTSALSSEFYTEAQKREEELEAEQQESDLAVTQGGSALVKPELASTEAAKITKTSIRHYVISEGDTIGSIAADFGVSVNTILWANNLSLTSLIKPNQKLIIPPVSGVLHKIAKGDTIKSIATKYKANAEEIKKFNGLEDGSLAGGEIIMVPGGQIVYTPKPRAYAVSPVSAPAAAAPQTVPGEMLWPETCRRLTQYYRNWIHTGLDIACGFGKPIFAAEDGVVTRVQYDKAGYGYHVIVDHGGGKQTLYGHNSQIYVQKGDSVFKGQTIAAEGSTGRSTGSHVHFEVRLNGSRVNPLNYVK